VEYIHTDTASFLQSETFDDVFVQTTVSLIDAAKYYILPVLLGKVVVLACTAMAKSPGSCVSYLAACEANLLPELSELEKLATGTIRNSPTALLEGGGSISLLSSSRLVEILKDKKLRTDKYTLFLILHAWAGEGDGDAKPPPEDDEEQKSRADHKRKVAALTKHLSLELIRPSDLSTTVKTSGLVTDSQML
jgi:hypothetical protein